MEPNNNNNGFGQIKMMTTTTAPTPKTKTTTTTTTTRLTPKQAEAVERRKRMTQRRQDLTNKIRKQKKSSYLAQKRQLQTPPATTTTTNASQQYQQQQQQQVNTATATTITTPNNTTYQHDYPTSRRMFEDMINTNSTDGLFCHLGNLQTILSNIMLQPQNSVVTKSHEAPLIVLSSSMEDERLAGQFLGTLAGWIEGALRTAKTTITTSQDTNVNHEQFRDRLRIVLKTLVDLSSFSSSRSSSTSGSSFGNDHDDDSYYYGRVPSTWSTLIVKSWLSILCEILECGQKQQQQQTATNTQDLLIINDEILYMCCLIVGNVVGEGPTTIQVISENLKQLIVRQLVEVISSSLHQRREQPQSQQKIQPQPQQPAQFDLASTAAWSLTNLIRQDVTSYARTYVMADEMLSPSTLQSWIGCYDYPSISTQATWIVASLTSREVETSLYLAQQGIVSSLLQCLYKPTSTDQQVPILQSLGNLASHSSIVPGLLQSTIQVPSSPDVMATTQIGATTTTTTTSINLVSILQNLLTNLPSGHISLVPTIWLSGCLLVDTGMPNNHPSTTLAGPILVPVIMSRLGASGSGSGRQLKLEEERELVSALWNALEQPPDLYGEWTTDQPFIMDIPQQTVQTIVRLMKSKDDDAVLASVHVLDLYLRRIGGSSMESLQSFQGFMRTLEEEDAVDALESICDSHLEDAANVAADLIDDFFADIYDNDNNESNDDNNNNTNNGQWNLDGTYPTENVFANPNGGGVSFGVGSVTFGFGNDQTTTPTDTPSPGMGRGRGRGATLPAWMNK